MPRNKDPRYRAGQVIDGRPICGAKTRSGAPCRQKPMANGRCRMHGGKNPSGVAHPSFKHGRYSKDIPQRLMARFEASLNDPDRLVLDREIALTDARLGELLSMLGTGESGWRWRQIVSHWREYRGARRRGDVQGMTEALEAVDGLIDGAALEQDAWAEIHALIQARRRLVESERRRILEAQEYLSIDEAMTVVTAIARSVDRHVIDRATKEAIAADLRAILARSGGGQYLEPASGEAQAAD